MEDYFKLTRPEQLLLCEKWLIEQDKTHIFAVFNYNDGEKQEIKFERYLSTNDKNKVSEQLMKDPNVKAFEVFTTKGFVTELVKLRLEHNLISTGTVEEIEKKTKLREQQDKALSEMILPVDQVSEAKKLGIVLPGDF